MLQTGLFEKYNIINIKLIIEMKKFKNIDSEELVSMNTELPEFFIEELEQRLETDPLIGGGLLDLFSPTGDPGSNSLDSDYCSQMTCDGYW